MFGQALLEWVQFDAGGHRLTSSLVDYALPRATDMPPLVLEHTVAPSPFNPLWAKRVGEAGTDWLPAWDCECGPRRAGTSRYPSPRSSVSAERVWRTMLAAKW